MGWYHSTMRLRLMYSLKYMVVENFIYQTLAYTLPH